MDADPTGLPVALRRRGWPSACPVVRVQDHWRLDDEWWRERPIARLYYTVVLADGAVLTLYHDLVANAWFEQRG